MCANIHPQSAEKNAEIENETMFKGALTHQQ
jgi:hypothetical protein